MPIYKPADYESVISRIKAKLRLLESKWEIVKFEEKNRVRLPQAYRVFLQKAGDGRNMIGGFPLHSPANMKAKDLSQPFMDEWIWEDDDTAWADLVKIMDAKLRGQFELIDVGCSMSCSLIVTGQCRGKVWSFADARVLPCCERQDWLVRIVAGLRDDADCFKDYIYG